MIKGSIVELVAPTEPNGAIKYQSLEALVDWHVVEGSAALLLGDTATDSSRSSPRLPSPRARGHHGSFAMVSRDDLTTKLFETLVKAASAAAHRNQGGDEDEYDRFKRKDQVRVHTPGWVGTCSHPG